MSVESDRETVVAVSHLSKSLGPLTVLRDVSF